MTLPDNSEVFVYFYQNVLSKCAMSTPKAASQQARNVNPSRAGTDYIRFFTFCIPYCTCINFKTC